MRSIPESSPRQAAPRAQVLVDSAELAELRRLAPIGKAVLALPVGWQLGHGAGLWWVECPDAVQPDPRTIASTCYQAGTLAAALLAAAEANR